MRQRRRYNPRQQENFPVGSLPMTLERATDCYPCQDQTIFGQNRVTDQVGGHINLAISAEIKKREGWQQEALHWIESAFHVEGFVSKHPYYKNCLKRRADLMKLLGRKDLSPNVVHTVSGDGIDIPDDTSYIDQMDPEEELVGAL